MTRKTKIKSERASTETHSLQYLSAPAKKFPSWKVDLTTRIGDLEFKNPITVASGTFGTKGEYGAFVNLEKLGAIITKTITVNPRLGNPMPRICETSGGMLNAIGLQNKGLNDFVENKIPFYRQLKTPLIVNIAGEKDDDFRLLAAALEKERDVVKAIELNFSCPNIEAGGAGVMRKKIAEVLVAVKAQTQLPLIAKLSPELGNVLEITETVIKGGVQAVSLINTLKGMAVDVERRCARLANITGGLSGPAIKPVALRYVYEVKKNFSIPVIASGGITTALDAVEFLIVGADLLAIGTANFINPTATLDILGGIVEYCRRYRIKHIDELRGSFCGKPQR